MGYRSLLTDNIEGQQVGDTMFGLDGGLLIWDGNEWLQIVQTDGTGLVEVTAHGDAERKYIPVDSNNPFNKWLQQLKDGGEITLEGNFIPHDPRTNEPIVNKPVEKFAFRKGISNVK
jgi:hypothetical protein